LSVTFIVMQATGRRCLMGKVVSHMTMSLDGFVADPHDGVEELFGWYEAGPVTVPSADERWLFKVDERSAQMLREVLAGTGARLACIFADRWACMAIVPVVPLARTIIGRAVTGLDVR
jgi:hypothetical protein